MNPSVTVVIPALNEESGIGGSISSIPDKSYEILVIDGKSKDNTVQIAKKAGAKVIVEPRRGYGRAYKTGFDAASGSILVATDADSTYPNERIPELVEYFQKNKLDFLSTNRFHKLEPGAMSFMNKFGNYVLSITSRLLFSAPFEDSQSGMWLISKEGWDRIKRRVKSDGMAFSQEIKIEAFRSGLKCGEMGIEYRKRHGDAKLNRIKDGLGNLFSLFRERLR